MAVRRAVRHPDEGALLLVGMVNLAHNPRVAARPQRLCAERRAQLVGHSARPTHRLCDALQQIGLALVGAAGARLATVPGLQAGQTTLLGPIRRMFPQDNAVIACLAERQEPGSQN